MKKFLSIFFIDYNKINKIQKLIINYKDGDWLCTKYL